MSSEPSVYILSASYENVSATCPYCGTHCLFNRVSDLRRIEPIDGMSVVCLNEKCGRSFWIMGDLASPSYQLLLQDCTESIALKHYMNCVLTVAQAYEVFFSLYLRVNLLYKPFYRGSSPLDLDQLQQTAMAFERRVTPFAFGKMRGAFLSLAMKNPIIGSLEESASLIARLNYGLPSKAQLERMSDARLKEHLILVRETRIGDLRNSVVHKQAYRPSKEEAEGAVEEALSILPFLGYRLDLIDDINWYGRNLVGAPSVIP